MNKFNLFFIIGVMVIGLAGCTNKPTEIGSTETTNGNGMNIQGKLVYTNGDPASGAKVQIFDVRYVPSFGGSAQKRYANESNIDTIIFTNSEGIYFFPLPDSGAYNIYGESTDGLVVLVDSINVRDTGGVRVGTDTVKTAGGIMGVSRMLGQNDTNQVRVTIYIPGTRFLTKPIIGGHFSFTKVPKGIYQVIFDPTLSNYSVKIMNIKVDDGHPTNLDTVLLYGGEFSGLPVVDAGFDTVVSIMDTIRLKGTAKDTLGKIIGMYWDIGNTGVFKKSVSGDTTIIAPAIGDSNFQCIFKVVDDDSNSKCDTINIRVLRDVPRIDSIRDTTVPISTPVTFNTISHQEFGLITAYKWDFNNDGTWDDSSLTSNTTTHIFNTLGLNTVVVAVIDDDRNTGIDTFKVFVGNFVGGMLPTDYVFKKALSPYIINQNLFIPFDYQVVIEAGVEIRFQKNMCFKIGGVLQAVGTQTDSIVFTSAELSPSPGDWQYIQFVTLARADGQQVDLIKATQRGIIPDRTNRVLKFCRIQYAQLGIYCDNGSSPTVSYCTITKNSDCGILSGGWDVCSPRITGNIIKDNGCGIHCDMGFPIIDSNIISNNYGGIYMESTDSATITNNVISNNMQDGIFAGYGKHVIKNNAIINNSDRGIYTSGGCQIMYNKISANGYGQANSVHPVNKAGIDVYSSSQVQITYNLIDSNKVGIICEGSDRTGLLISNNNICHNLNNNFSNQNSSDITVQQNWWGSVDGTIIDSGIFDYYDDFQYGKVLYQPAANDYIPNAGNN